jgi:hypothetical protein
MSGLFTLGIGALFNVEKLNMIKFMAVLIRYTLLKKLAFYKQ